MTPDCESDMRVSSEANPGMRMLWFRSVRMDAEQHSSRITNEPTEMELQILHLQRIPSSMFRKPTTEIGHGIDELVCDLQEQLHIASATG